MFAICVRSLNLTIRQKKMMSLLWAVSFLFALPGFWVIHRSLNSYFGGRGVASDWLHQFNFNNLIEMVNDFPTILTTFGSLFFSTALLFIVVSIFFTGGIIGTMIRIVSGNTAGSFFESCGTFFFRFLRTFSWTMLLSVVSLSFMMIGGYAGLIAAALIAVWIMTSDITKIRLISENSGKVTKTYFSSLVWIFKNFPSIAIVYLMNFALLILGFVIYKILDNAITPDRALKIFLMLIIQQAFVFFRGAIRIQMFGSAVLLWNSKLRTSTPVILDSPEVSSGEQALPA